MMQLHVLLFIFFFSNYMKQFPSYLYFVIEIGLLLGGDAFPFCAVL